MSIQFYLQALFQSDNTFPKELKKIIAEYAREDDTTQSSNLIKSYILVPRIFSKDPRFTTCFVYVVPGPCGFIEEYNESPHIRVTISRSRRRCQELWYTFVVSFDKLVRCVIQSQWKSIDESEHMRKLLNKWIRSLHLEFINKIKG
jgi:hypothetical protein